MPRFEWLMLPLANTGGMVDKHRALVGVGGAGVGVSVALLFGEHDLHQGPQALAPAGSGAPGPAGGRHPSGVYRAHCERARVLGQRLCSLHSVAPFRHIDMVYYHNTTKRQKLRVPFRHIDLVYYHNTKRQKLRVPGIYLRVPHLYRTEYPRSICYETPGISLYDTAVTE